MPSCRRARLSRVHVPASASACRSRVDSGGPTPSPTRCPLAVALPTASAGLPISSEHERGLGTAAARGATRPLMATVPSSGATGARGRHRVRARTPRAARHGGATRARAAVQVRSPAKTVECHREVSIALRWQSMAINGNQCHREVSIALLHLEATSLTTCNALPTLMRLCPFDWLHTDGRFPPRCIPPPLASRLSAAVTTIRLEHVSSNFSVEMARAFDGLLPSLRLPPWTRVAATGAADSGGSPKPSPSELGHGRGDGDQSTERLVQAAAKFDLSHHAPPPDKLDHVSDKDAKQRLREVRASAVLDLGPSRGAHTRNSCEPAKGRVSRAAGLVARVHRCCSTTSACGRCCVGCDSPSATRRCRRGSHRQTSRRSRRRLRGP